MKKHFISLSLVLLTVASICCGCASNQGATGQLYASTSNIFVSTVTPIEEPPDPLLLGNRDRKLAVASDILQDSKTQAPVKAAYPNADYTCELKVNGNTEIYSIVVTGKKGEPLKEICEILTNEFSTQWPLVTGLGPVTIIKTASNPAKVTD